MTTQAVDLLRRMAAAYDSTHETEFDMDFYMGTSEAALSELEIRGYIVRKNNIIGSIVLTDAGYQAGKE